MKQNATYHTIDKEHFNIPNARIKLEHDCHRKRSGNTKFINNVNRQSD